MQQDISDPDTFELSEIVDKSSKTGIFTNQRLLIIKDGFLTYLSKVPPNYRANDPNLMSTLREFPKSSIQIRSIKDIHLQSAKSSTLIIGFHGKDMIDRQDIRRSISSKNYNHPVKPNSDEPQQWKFTFSSLDKCRKWYNSLMKLKQHFSKVDDGYDKFAELLANYDPNIRKSLPQLSPNYRNSAFSQSQRVSIPTQSVINKESINLQPPLIQKNASNQKYKLDKESGIFSIEETVEQHDEEVVPKKKQEQIKIQDLINNAQKQAQTNVEKEKEVLKSEKSNEEKKIEQFTISTHQTKKQEENKSSLQNSKKIKQNEKNNNCEVKIQNDKLKIQLKSNQVSKPVEKKIEKIETKTQKKQEKQQVKNKANQIQQEIEKNQKKYELLAQAIRKEEQKKAQQQADNYARELQQKENQIAKMAEQMNKSKKMQQLLQEQIRQEQLKRQQNERLRLRMQRQRREQEEYKRLRQSLGTQTYNAQPQTTTQRQIKIQQQSIQTSFQRQLMESGGSKSNINKASRYSYKSDLSLNPVGQDRDTINLFRNTISYMSQVKVQANDQIDNYDYFWQLGQIYKSNDLKERISKQLALVQFVRNATKRATQIITTYIDANKPTSCLHIDRHIFDIEIVCERGKVIRTEGSQQLIYSNEQHQRLKRTYKINNQLTQIIIASLKKKHSYPLRAPFCCLIEYKGYTAIARIIPTLKNSSINNHLLKKFAPNVPVYNLILQDFETNGCIFSLFVPTLFYKVTKDDEPSIFRLPFKNFDFLNSNRKVNISIESKKLFQECKQIENNKSERSQHSEIINFCRQLKKIMKNNFPFAQTNQLKFFQDFIVNPYPLINQYFFNENDKKIIGLLIFYIEKLLGIRLNSRFDEKPNITILPVIRQYFLSSLDISLFAYNFQKFCQQKKFDVASKALNYRKYLQQDYTQILLMQANLHIHKQQYNSALQKLQLSFQMISFHDPKRLKIIQLQAQCYQTNRDDAASMSCLKQLLEHTQYMYGNKINLIEVYFLIAGSLSRQKLIPQLTQVYRKIIQDSPENRQRVIVQFSQSLMKQEDIDPHVLLDFLHQQISIDIENKEPLVQQLLGQLYLRSKNKIKALNHFTNSYNQLLSESKNLEAICECLLRLFECSTSLQQRKSLHRQFCNKFSQNIQFTNHPLCKRINTIIAQLICSQFNFEERDTIINFLQDIKQLQNCQLLDWNWIQSLLKKAVKQQQIGMEEKYILFSSIEIAQLSQACILLNSPNLM